MRHDTNPEKNLSGQQNFDSVPFTKQTQSATKAPGKRAAIKSSISIADLWAAVLDDYENERKHQEFILSCYRAGCLYYASQKYARILNTTPGESIALKMQTQIEVFAMKDHLARPIEKKRTSNSSRLSDLVAIVGVLIALAGFISPNFRNLVGVGISIFVMAAGFKYFVSKPHH